MCAYRRLAYPQELFPQLRQRADDQRKVLCRRLHHHVDVLSHIVNHAVQEARHTTNREVGDAVPIERLDNSRQVDGRSGRTVTDRTQGCGPSRVAAKSTHGSSAVAGGKVGYNSTARRPAPGGCTRPSRAKTYTQMTSSRLSASELKPVISCTALRNSPSPTLAMICSARRRSLGSIVKSTPTFYGR